jgi:hypothetical protein
MNLILVFTSLIMKQAHNKHHATLYSYFYELTDQRNSEEENATSAGRSLQKVLSVLKP